MIKEEITYKDKFVTKTITETLPEKEKLITYTCSDGTKFTNEEDGNQWGFKGIEKAELYEEKLRIQLEAKKELKFHSIVNKKHDNEGYERKFYFYYHNNLSNLAKKALSDLIFNYNKLSSKLNSDGWYIVKQKLGENRTGDDYYTYVRSSIFERLDVYVKSLKEKYIFYESLPLD